MENPLLSALSPSALDIAMLYGYMGGDEKMTEYLYVFIKYVNINTRSLHTFYLYCLLNVASQSSTLY